EPGATLDADELRGLLQGSARRADVDGGVQELGVGSVGGGSFEGPVLLQDELRRDPDPGQVDGAAGGGALAHAGPVVLDPDPGVVGADERDVRSGTLGGG